MESDDYQMDLDMQTLLQMQMADDIRAMRRGQSQGCDDGGNVLIVRTPKSTGFLYNVKVSADRNCQGELTHRGQLRFWLSPGPHTIKVSGGGFWKSLEVVVSESRPLRLETYFSNWGLLGGGLKLKQV